MFLRGELISIVCYYYQYITSFRFQIIYKEEKLTIDLEQILQLYDASNLTHIIIGTVLIQMGLYELIKGLKVNIYGIYGSSIGILTSSYANKSLSLKDVALISYVTVSLLKQSSITVADYKNGCREEMEKLSMKLCEKIMQLLINKHVTNGSKMLGDEVKDLATNILLGTVSDFFADEETVLIYCGGNAKIQNNSDYQLMQMIDPSDEKTVDSLLSNLGR